MRIKEGFVLREVAGKYVVIATGEASKSFNGMITLNQTGKEIWEGVTAGLGAEEIAEKLSEDFEVSYEKALEDTKKMMDSMKHAGFLTE